MPRAIAHIDRDELRSRLRDARRSDGPVPAWTQAPSIPVGRALDILHDTPDLGGRAGMVMDRLIDDLAQRNHRRSLGPVLDLIDVLDLDKQAAEDTEARWRADCDPFVRRAIAGKLGDRLTGNTYFVDAVADLSYQQNGHDQAADLLAAHNDHAFGVLLGPGGMAARLAATPVPAWTASHWRQPANAWMDAFTRGGRNRAVRAIQGAIHTALQGR